MHLDLKTILSPLLCEAHIVWKISTEGVLA